MAENNQGQAQMVTIGPSAQPQVMSNATQQASEEFKHLIQGLMTVAMAQPRNQAECERQILMLCQDLDFADKALYEYTKGEKVIGLSIYAVNEIKRIWGRLYDGWDLLDTVKGKVREEIKDAQGKKSVIEVEVPFTNVRAICVDLQSCNLTYRTFKVPHRFKAGGKDNPYMKDLYDERDVYEYCANLSQRRKRSCIEEQIPLYLRRAFIKQIQETKLNADTRPLSVRVQLMLDSFVKAKIPEAAVLNYLGCSKTAITAQQVADMKSIYVALGDGEAKISDFFDVKAKPKDAPKSRTTRRGKPVTPTEGEETLDVKQVDEPPANNPAAKTEPAREQAASPPAEPPKEIKTELPEVDLDADDESEDDQQDGDLGDDDEPGTTSWGFDA